MVLSRQLPPTPVRESVGRLADDLRRVRVNTEAVETTAAEWADREFELPAWRAPVFPDERQPGVTPADVFDFMFVGNAINFAFREFETGRKFTAEYDGHEWRGAFGMWACLKRAHDTGIPITSEQFLADLSRDDFDDLFTPVDGTQLPLATERYEILTGLGERLVAAEGERFHDLFETESVALYDDGFGFVDELVERFPSFRDEWRVETTDDHMTVRFDKRGQLLAGMLFGRFGDGWFSIESPTSFSVFADYNLPNVLRSLGILEYDSALAEEVDAGRPLEPGSRPEVELRAATLLAADELAVQLSRSRDRPVTGPELDYALFQARDGVETEPHRCRTTAY
ncbi:queuosine salvage family protein [Halobaculum sp. MBLA0143]|uniref:queuosine salvage family protein n=1 Tax=Halobaculum sp. MBLA0143 TaxID=3079933 RepID=UPI003524C37D